MACIKISLDFHCAISIMWITSLIRLEFLSSNLCKHKNSVQAQYTLGSFLSLTSPCMYEQILLKV